MIDARKPVQQALDAIDPEFGARHYGYAAQLTGAAHAAIRTWLAEGETFRVD